MSFNELRDFVAIMRTLGFRHAVRVDSFRAGDFQLMSRCLTFLLKMHVPDANLADDISTPQDRQFFVSSAVTIAQGKAHIALNAPNLYRSDSLAVREMLKLARPLLVALRAGAHSAAAQGPLPALDPALVSETKAVGETLTAAAAAVCRGIGDAPQWSDALARALAQQHDVRVVAEAVRTKREAVRAQTEEAQEALRSARLDARRLSESLRVKRHELQTTRQRAQNLSGVKPAFLAELEQREAQLAELHGRYVARFRSLAFVEAQLRAIQTTEEARKASERSSLRAIQARAQKEDMILLAGGGSSDEEGNSSSEPKPTPRAAPDEEEEATRDPSINVGSRFKTVMESSYSYDSYGSYSYSNSAPEEERVGNSSASNDFSEFAFSSDDL